MQSIIYQNLTGVKFTLRTYVLSSEVANREIFARILFGIKKWAGGEMETTIVSLGDETEADLW